MRVWLKEIRPSDGNIQNSLSHYRANGPYSKLHRLDTSIDVHLVQPGEYIHHSTISEYDVAVFQRPIIESEVQSIAYFKRLGIPVILDYDDNLFDVPFSNPTYQLYQDEAIRNNIHLSLGMADVVTTTNEEMKRVLGEHGAQRVEIIPNAIDDYLFPCKPLEKREKIITWRGASGHEEDLWHYKDDIVELLDSMPGYKIKMFGAVPWFMIDMLKDRLIVVHPMELIDYMEELRLTGAEYHIVPLKDTPFNRCKSDISKQEGCWAGSSVICKLRKDADYYGFLSLSKVNAQRVKLLKELVNG